MTNIRSLAGRVLAKTNDPDTKALAAYVLGDESPTRTTDRRDDMTKAKTEKTEDKVETVEIPARIIQPIAGGCAPADVDADREKAKQEVREALAGKD